MSRVRYKGKQYLLVTRTGLLMRVDGNPQTQREYIKNLVMVHGYREDDLLILETQEVDKADPPLEG